MNLSRLFGRSNPGRDLAQLGVEKQRRAVKDVARRIREELGLPADQRLA